MKGLYWENTVLSTVYTASIGKYEVSLMWSFWRFRGSSGDLEKLAEA